MDQNPLVSIVQNEDLFVPLIMAGVAVVWIVMGTVTGMVKAVARERTRREIAAYIAEGSMTPEHGERLMKAGRQGCAG
jgi:hypothetical protein